MSYMYCMCICMYISTCKLNIDLRVYLNKYVKNTETRKNLRIEPQLPFKHQIGNLSSYREFFGALEKSKNMFPITTLAHQMRLKSFQHFAARGMQTQAVLSREIPHYDEKYTEVVDRLIRESEIRREKARRTDQPKESKMGSVKPPQKTEPSYRNGAAIKMTLSKTGEQIIGKFSKQHSSTTFASKFIFFLINISFCHNLQNLR